LVKARKKDLQWMRKPLEIQEINLSIMVVSREEQSYSQSMKKVEMKATKMKAPIRISTLKTAKGSLLQPQ